MDRIRPPLVRSDQIQPFTLDQARALIYATKHTRNSERDEAILRMLLDTGMRASELCSIRMEKLDLFGQRVTILGKGNKVRGVHFGSKAARALRNYLRLEDRSPEDVVFQSAKNQYAGQPLTAGALLQLIEHLGKSAGIQAVRCSPHTIRHTFAIEFLRNGGNVFSLKEILGHSSLHMTNRYVALAQADIDSSKGDLRRATVWEFKDFNDNGASPVSDKTGPQEPTAKDGNINSANYRPRTSGVEDKDHEAEQEKVNAAINTLILGCAIRSINFSPLQRVLIFRQIITLEAG